MLLGSEVSKLLLQLFLLSNHTCDLLAYTLSQLLGLHPWVDDDGPNQGKLIQCGFKYCIYLQRDEAGVR
jgi:hypothetical protein